MDFDGFFPERRWDPHLLPVYYALSLLQGSWYVLGASLLPFI